MPYDVDKPADVKSMREKLQKTYGGLDDTAVRQAIHVWNSVMDSGSDEGKAWAAVYSAMNKRGLTKTKKASYVRPPARMVSDIAKDIAELIEEADVPLEERQKAQFFYDLVDTGHLRRKWLEERLWEGAQDYVYETDDEEEQGELMSNVEGEVNDLLLKQGVIGRRAKGAAIAEDLERIASAHPEHAATLQGIAAEFREGAASPPGVKELWNLVQKLRKAYFALEDAAKVRLPREYRHLDGEVNYSFESLYNTLAQVEEAWDGLVSQVKLGSGWIPGELREDKVWETGEVDATPSSHREEGSQVPPARDQNGYQLDPNGVPVDSIPRAKAAFGWSDDDIIEYYDNNPDVTLRELSRMTGRTVGQLKKLLMPGRRASEDIDSAWNKLAERVRSRR